MLLAQEGEELLARVGLRHDPVLDVGPVEAGHEVPGVRHAQPLGDLPVRGVRGGRGEGDAGHVRPPLPQHGQGEVVGPEVVAPLGDAVRLVDGEDGDLAAREEVQAAVQAQPLRGQVEQVELAGEELRLDRPPLVEVLRGVHEPGPHAERPQRVDLVLHQRDQRGDDHTRTGPDQGRDLVAQRLAAAGRHEHDRVAAGDHMVDDRLLLAAEGLVAEDPVQRSQRLTVRHCHPGDTVRPVHRPVPRGRTSATASTIGVRTDSPGVVHRPARNPPALFDPRPRRDRERPRPGTPCRGTGPRRAYGGCVSARTPPRPRPGPGSTAAPHRAPP